MRGRLRRAALARSLPAALAAAFVLLPAPPVMAVNCQPITIKGDTTAAGIAVGQVGGLALEDGLGAVWSPSQPGPGYDAAAIAPFGGAFPCYASTYARDVKTPASGPLCVVGFVNDVNALSCTDPPCFAGPDEHAALWQDAGLPQALAELDERRVG